MQRYGIQSGDGAIDVALFILLIGGFLGVAPLAGFAGVPTHLIVTAYQSASGLVNLVTPTFAVVTGGLAIGRISFAVWWKWVAVLVLLLALVIMVVLSIGALTGA
jgi:uncharacterized ion transporter superfamily protein YfcC